MTSDFYCNRNSAGGSTQVAKLLTKLVVTKIFSGGNWRYFSIFGLSVSSWYHRHHPFISFQTNILCCNNLSAQFHSFNIFINGYFLYPPTSSALFSLSQTEQKQSLLAVQSPKELSLHWYYTLPKNVCPWWVVGNSLFLYLSERVCG